MKEDTILSYMKTRIKNQDYKMMLWSHFLSQMQCYFALSDYNLSLGKLAWLHLFNYRS